MHRIGVSGAPSWSTKQVVGDGIAWAKVVEVAAHFQECLSTHGGVARFLTFPTSQRMVTAPVDQFTSSMRN
jgi:hypothetical protein